MRLECRVESPKALLVSIIIGVVFTLLLVYFGSMQSHIDPNPYEKGCFDWWFWYLIN